MIQEIINVLKILNVKITADHTSVTVWMALMETDSLAMVYTD